MNCWLNQGHVESSEERRHCKVRVCGRGATAGCKCTIGTNPKPELESSGEFMGTNKKWIVRTAQENQHLLKALSVSIRFSHKCQKIQNNSGLMRQTLASLLRQWNQEVESTGLEGQRHTVEGAAHGSSLRTPPSLGWGPPSWSRVVCQSNLWGLQGRARNKGCMPTVSSSFLEVLPALLLSFHGCQFCGTQLQGSLGDIAIIC